MRSGLTSNNVKVAKHWLSDVTTPFCTELNNDWSFVYALCEIMLRGVWACESSQGVIQWRVEGGVEGSAHVQYGFMKFIVYTGCFMKMVVCHRQGCMHHGQICGWGWYIIEIYAEITSFHNLSFLYIIFSRSLLRMQFLWHVADDGH